MSALMQGAMDRNYILTMRMSFYLLIMPCIADMTYSLCPYSYRSLQGHNRKPPHKPNQDSFVIDRSLGGNSSLFLMGVFDGHGPYGDSASVSKAFI